MDREHAPEGAVVDIPIQKGPDGTNHQAIAVTFESLSFNIHPYKGLPSQLIAEFKHAVILG